MINSPYRSLYFNQLSLDLLFHFFIDYLDFYKYMFTIHTIFHSTLFYFFTTVKYSSNIADALPFENISVL